MAEKKPRLLTRESDGFSSGALKYLREVFDVETAQLNRSELLQSIETFEYVWVRLAHYIDAQIMDHGKRLRAIATNTTGLNHIDLEAARERSIEVISLRGETEFLKRIRATAELTLGICLALLRKIPAAHDHCRRAEWDRTLFQGSEIHEKTIGIIGFGRLGSIVANYFQAMGADVVFHSPEYSVGTSVSSYRSVPLNELLAVSDIVSLHVNFTPENKRMIRAEHFRWMKTTSVFINTARGELVDQAALAEALETGQIAGAAIDVLENEQSDQVVPQRLIDLASQNSNLILTPHIGGNTRESLAKTETFLAEKLCLFQSQWSHVSTTQ